MSAPLNSPAPQREPQLLKFDLKQLFLIVTLAGLFCTLMVLTHGPWPLVILIVTLLVVGHVLGTLIGTRLRDSSQDICQWRVTDPRQDSDYPRSTPEPYELAKLSLPRETNLANFSHLVRGMRWYLLTGFLIGSVLGGTLLAVAIGDRIGWPGWMVGTISSGVMGTWVAFLGVSFTVIAREAVRQTNGRQ